MPTLPAPCPPVPRPPWPYDDGYVSAEHISGGRRKVKRRVVGGWSPSPSPGPAPPPQGSDEGDGITH